MENEKLDIQVGDKITYKHKAMEVENTEIVYELGRISTLLFEIKEGNMEILKIERPKYEVVEENKELLIEEEKEFLKQVLRFIDIKILSINIYKQEISNKKEIHFNQNEDGSGLGYWYYIKNSYFNGLEINKVYTLKELGLEEN